MALHKFRRNFCINLETSMHNFMFKILFASISQRVAHFLMIEMEFSYSYDEKLDFIQFEFEKRNGKHFPDNKNLKKKVEQIRISIEKQEIVQ